LNHEAEQAFARVGPRNAPSIGLAVVGIVRGRQRASHSLAGFYHSKAGANLLLNQLESVWPMEEKVGQLLGLQLGWWRGFIWSQLTKSSVISLRLSEGSGDGGCGFNWPMTWLASGPRFAC